ncbi:MAG: FAD-dependent oxidoreductase [Cytophagales bacterium]|nr:MAG: FAD-dependent oxidoreductase [Cytophagales bacterium]
MKYLIYLITSFTLMTLSQFCSPKGANEKSTEVDICVYGGTASGVITAYTAKKMGKSVILIEPTKHLGGLTTGGLGFTDIGNKFAITGLARDFYRRIGQHYGKFEQWIFEPHVAENLLLTYIKEANINVLYQNRLLSVDKNDGFIGSIVIENAAQPSPQTNQIIKAKMFIDCTYEGDLMAKAGVSYTYGREANSQYGETYNGVQMLDKHQFPDGIDPYKIKGKPESGLLWGINPEPVLPNGSGDKKLQAYNFRMCLSKNPQNQIPIIQPENYDPSKYELLLRQVEITKPQVLDWQLMHFATMPNDKTDINNCGGFSTDMIGANYQYAEADYDTRKKIVKAHEDYTKGLLYFIGNDSRMPEHLRNEMKQFGYPKDEYIDNGGWSPQLYIREARRMVGEYVMTQHNCQGREIATDAIGMAAYTMDSHNCSRFVINGMVKNEGDVQVGGFPPYPISYRSLTPKKNECKNLLVPVCLSSTHIAFGSIRMEPVFMVLGQSSAVAASLAIDAKIAVQEVAVEKMQEVLKNNPMADGRTPEILVDNDDKENTMIEGEWKNEKIKGCYGLSLLNDDSKGSIKKSIQFTPSISKAGEYAIYAYFPKMPNMATLVNMGVFDGKVNKPISVKPNDIEIVGQTSGEWVNLGKYQLPQGKESHVSISNQGADGLVVADAVLFVPTN